MLFRPAVAAVFSRAVPMVMLSAKTLIGPAIFVTFAVEVAVAPASDSLLRVTDPPDCAVAPLLSRPMVKLVTSVLKDRASVSRAVSKAVPEG